MDAKEAEYIKEKDALNVPTFYSFLMIGQIEDPRRDVK